MHRLWTKQEIEILKNLWEKVSLEDIAKVLIERSERAIYDKALKIGLPPAQAEIDLDYYRKLLEMKKG